MQASHNIFFLKIDGETLGTITFEREDWPWNFGKFSPAEGFANYKALFDAAITESNDPELKKKHPSLNKIVKMNLWLVCCDNGMVAGEPDLLWIDGERTWWRGNRGLLRKSTDIKND